MTKIREPRRFGPGWPIRPAGAGPDPTTALPGALASRRAFSWYLGATFSLFWVFSTVPAILREPGAPLENATGIALVLLFSVCFLAAPPVAWTFGTRGRVVVCLAVLALTLLFVPWLGPDVVGLWTYVGVTVGMCVFSWPRTIAAILALTLGALVVRVLTEPWSDALLVQPVIILSISLMMSAFARTIAVVNELRATQAELEAVTAERERGRVARDIHDILGHSLTVITVKSELAARLLDVDPGRARAEIQDVETIARGALADVRATVSGVRGTTASGELAAARGALDAAGVRAELPSSTDVVPAAQRELVGWVIREGVTNVVRHAGASRCRIRIAEDSVTIDDDGTGPVVTAVGGPSAAPSTGLRGLRERVESVGGTLEVGRGELGGFALTVTLPRARAGIRS
ncbi:sensor histidine kinase [Herbiconiux flava]|uniref:Two-component system sensor histidine kinase DesK n=1 Tax=Herbiconiux flava TaxID=881268 RepID=A0A852SU49_9MICO|nr:sensor histidine kinase [Herbiconiux flava]NYD72174.1 two-component system sensor histidine kinase DesK [Herbiconiux flava]GLK17862.1 histidine kinase [Herbiconiux flava]